MSELYQKTTNVGYTSNSLTTTGSRTRGGVLISQNSAGATVRIADVDTLDGVKNPFWRKQIATGQNATTHCTGKRLTVDNEFVTAGYSYYSPASPNTESFGEWYGYHPVTLPVLGNPPASVVTEVHNRVIRKFLTACENARSSVEVGQDLGEYKQTIEGLIRPMSSMRKTIVDHYERLTKASRRYRAWDVPSRTKALADSYLEWTFGMKPLLSDVAGAYVGLQNAYRHMSNIQPVSAHARGSYSGSNIVANLTGQLLSVRGNKKSVSYYSERMKGGYRLGLQADGRLLPLDILQLRTLDDFKITAWDLLPYSFLIDYFANIGDLIHASCATRFNLAWGVQSTRTTIEEEISYNSISDLTSVFGTVRTTSNWCKGGNSKVTSTSFIRNALTPASLIPEFRLSLPTSAKPWVNIAALVLSGGKLCPFYKQR